MAHACTLSTGTTFSYFSKTWSVRKQWKLSYIKAAAVCKWNKRWRIFYKGFADYADAHFHHMHSKYWYILNPYSKIIYFYNIFAFFAIIILLIICPLGEVLFDTITRMPIINAFNFILLLDIIVFFFRGWPDYLNKIIIYNPQQIAIHYIKSHYFAFDVIPLLPINYLLELLFNNDYITLIPILHSFIFICYFAKIVKVSFYFSEIAHIFYLKSNIKRTVRLILLFLLAHHLFACCHLFAGGLGFYEKMILNKKEDTWLKNVTNIDYLFIYLVAIWRSFKLTLTGETFHLQHCNEMIISWINRVCSYLWFTMIIVEFNILKVPFQDRYEQFLSYVRQFMKNKLVYSQIQRRIMNYFYYFIRNGRYINEKNLLQLLPDGLHLEILAARCYYLVEKSYLFADLPKEIVQKMCSEVTPEIYLTNDVIIKSGLVGCDMFFIAQGTVQILTPLGKEVVLLEDGDHFGEVSLIFENQKRMASVLAVENCLLYRLKKSTFDKIIRPYNAIMERIIEKAHSRILESQLVDSNLNYLQVFKHPNVNLRLNDSE